MIYFIERETALPFDNAIKECQIGDKVYDLVVDNRNVGLERISDHIVNDNQLGMVFEKTNPREESLIKSYIEENFGTMSELLLG